MKNRFLKILQNELGTELYETACSSFENAKEGDLEGLVSFVCLVNLANQKNDLFSFVDLKELAKKLSKNVSIKKETILLLLSCNERLFKEILVTTLNVKNVSSKINIVARPEKTKKLSDVFPKVEEYSGCGFYSSC